MAYSFKNIRTAIVTFSMMAVSSIQADICANNTCCPQTCCSSGSFFLNAEALYMKAYQGGLSSLCNITRAVDTIEDGVLVSRMTGKGHEPDFRWDWGYRVGVGYGFADTNCGAGVFWTHFNQSTKGSINRWKLDYDVVDILFNCNCSLPCCFSLAPIAGIKLANIDQHVHSNFCDSQNTFSAFTHDHARQRLRGFGPLLGLQAGWDSSCGFSAYGNVAVALLYGNSRIHWEGEDLFDSGINIDNLKDHRTSYQVVLDTGIGVQWKQTFCDDSKLALRLGFEDHRFFNHNQFGDYGDLSLAGLSFGFAFEY